MFFVWFVGGCGLTVPELNPRQAAAVGQLRASRVKYAALWHRRDASISDLMRRAAPLDLSTTVSVERSAVERLRGETAYECPRPVFNAIMMSMPRNYGF